MYISLENLSLALNIITFIFLFACIGLAVFRKNAPHLACLALVIAVISLMTKYYINADYVDYSELGTPAQFGQLGDYFGGMLNPVFGFLTVILLLTSIKEQRNANNLFQRAEHISINKSEIKEGIDIYNKNLDEILKQDVFQHDPEGYPKISFKNIVNLGTQKDDNNSRIGELRGKIRYVMDCHQNGDNEKLRIFVEKNDDKVILRENALIVNMCADIRSIIATIRRGNIDLINLEETEFLLQVRKKAYISTLVEWSNLKLISRSELKVFIEECNSITMKKLKVIIR